MPGWQHLCLSSNTIALCKELIVQVLQNITCEPKSLTFGFNFGDVVAKKDGSVGCGAAHSSDTFPKRKHATSTVLNGCRERESLLD